VRIAGRRAYGQAAAVHVPLLIVQGTQDDVVKPAYTRRLARRFPHTPRYLEVNAGHDLIKPVHADWPTVEQAVLEFAASLL
jgi:pimeloyl-ACP methyl ester carboxylesterase